MKQLFLLLMLTFGLFFNLQAQDKPRVFIAPMENGFNEFLTAAIIKEKIPVQLVITDEGADYLITGSLVKDESKWYDTLFGTEKDRNSASITLLRLSDKSIVWAGSAGDKMGFWDTAWSKTGFRKVASRLAKSLKKDFFNEKKKK
jgi:hypothetical protein